MRNNLLNIVRKNFLCNGLPDVMRKGLLVVPVLAMALMLSGCGDKNDEPDVQLPTTVNRTVLVYMVADNSLGADWGCDQDDINEMIAGVKGGALNGGRLIVYHNRPNTAQNPPQLLEITGDGQITVLKNYPDDVTVYSVDPERISEVMADMKSLAPAEDYGLVLWSHANGWLGASSDYDDKYRAFGDDRGYHISVQTLAQTLKDERFAFVYFDCCLMGNVETLYELRNIAPIMVASPTELGIDGMPYDENVPLMFSRSMSVEDAMVESAENTFKYYYEGRSEYNEECQIAVYNTANLDALARVTRPIMETMTSYPGQDIMLSLQEYTVAPHYSYDMYQFMTALSAVKYPELCEAWREQWRKTVLYAASTPKGIGNISFYQGSFNGIGMFVIDRPSYISWRKYNTLQWWTDVVSAAPIFESIK